MDQYRVLVVDDSAFMRKIITDLVEKDPQFTVIATAVNGIEAVSSVQQYDPDVITLDLEMPMMNGIDALQQILKKHKVPIIMLSGISEANTRDTIKALQFGAFDFIRKPTGVGAKAQDIHTVGEMLLEKLKIAVLTKRKTTLLKKPSNLTELDKKSQDNLLKYAPNLLKNDNIRSNRVAQQQQAKPSFPSSKQEGKEAGQPGLPNSSHSSSKLLDSKKTNDMKPFSSPTGASLENSTAKKSNSVATPGNITSIIAIGTSTGGPRALHEVISNLPGDLCAPVVIVQHMPPRFTKSLAQRLDHFSALEVCEAEQGMKLENGKVYVAPGGKHMTVASQKDHYIILLNAEPPRNGHRPSVDVLFDSLLDFQELERHIVLMTGMGSDGAQGMKKLADQGVASTIAEAEESCVVYGMPRSAVELGAASKVLPLSHIAPELTKLLSNH